MAAARRLRQPIAANALHVLICEDDPILALEREALVVGCGAMTCGAAATFAEARALAELSAPDLVLMDLHLHDGHTGPRLAEIFAEAGLRIVVISGDSCIDGTLARLDHVFLSKPIQPVALEGLIAAAIQAKAQAGLSLDSSSEPERSM